MNDLRSQNRAPLAPVHPLGPRTGETAPGPSRSRAGNPLFQDSRAYEREQLDSDRPRRRGRPGEPAPVRFAANVDPAGDEPISRPQRRRESLMEARSDAPRAEPGRTDAERLEAARSQLARSNGELLGDGRVNGPHLGGLSFRVSQEMAGDTADRTRPAAPEPIGVGGPTADEAEPGNGAHDHDEPGYNAHRSAPAAGEPPAGRSTAARAATGRGTAGGGASARGAAATGRSAAARGPAGVDRRRPLDDDPAAQAPATRPAKRREAAEGEPGDDEKFPWHFSFKNDEPQELQAKTPLLARAFRSSVG